MKIKKTLKPQRETKKEEITENRENIWTEDTQRKSTKKHKGKHRKSRTTHTRLEKGWYLNVCSEALCFQACGFIHAVLLFP